MHITQAVAYDNYRQAISEELKEGFDSREGFLYDLLRYHLGWTDERGQPQDNALSPHLSSMLALVTCEAFSGDYTPALPVAAAVELMYNFTLVHGEVQAGRIDSQERPSIWWVWGPAQAINAGDGLHAMSRAAVMRLSQHGVPPERVLQAVESLDRACLSMCEGQYMDLTFQDQLMVTSTDYYGMIQRKTGSLTSCSARLGALVTGADHSECDRFGEAGSLLGMAWQISQDINDLWGQHGDGVTPSNILNKKKSLPIIYTLETVSTSVKRELGNIYMKRVLEPEDASHIVGILAEAGAREYAEGKASELVEQSVQALESTGLDQDGRRALEEFSRQILAGGFSV